MTGTRKLINNSMMSLISRILAAIISVISLPIILGVYGKSNYGLIGIAFTLNTFIAIIQMGLPTSVPKFVSEWLEKSDFKSIFYSGKTLVTIYGLIGLINSATIFYIAFYKIEWFSVAADQVEILRNLLLITAAFALFSVPLTVLDQLLAGAQEIVYISYLQILTTTIYFALVVVVWAFPEFISLEKFYLIRCLILLIALPISLLRWRKYTSLRIFIPGYDLVRVRPILYHSFHIFLFSVFIVVSKRTMPIILSIKGNGDVGALMTEYQIIENFSLLISLISAAIMSSLVPYLAQMNVQKDKANLKVWITNGTKIVWGGGALLGFGIAMLSREALDIYVGSDYVHLAGWLSIYILASLYYIYYCVLASSILSTDKLIPLVCATGFGCIFSLLICWYFVPYYGVGGVVLAFVAYVLIHFFVTHVLYLGPHFNINPWSHFLQVFLPPFLFGFVMWIVVRIAITTIGFTDNTSKILLAIPLGVIIYLTLVCLFYIRPNKLFAYMRAKTNSTV